MNADGSGVAPLTYDRTDESAPAWSPDGQRIAFSSDRDGPYVAYISPANVEIHSMNADGSDIMRLTYDDAWDDFPAWSPDGQRIAFHSTRDGDFEI